MATRLKTSTAVKCLIFFVVVILLNARCVCNTSFYTKRLSGKTNTLTMSGVSCSCPDSSFVKIHQCFLKPINRTHKFFTTHVTIIKGFTKPVMVHFQILKKANGGFKPFGIDVTLDGCRYMEGKRNPIFDWFFDMIFKYSNVNHTCPYQGDIFFLIPVKDVKFPSVFPDGEYRFVMRFTTLKKLRLETVGFVNIKEVD